MGTPFGYSKKIGKNYCLMVTREAFGHILGCKYSNLAILGFKANCKVEHYLVMKGFFVFLHQNQ